MDADKEGFLRSSRSLIQTIGRAARNASGEVIMYADEVTDSMEIALKETDRRRKIQMQYNGEHGITPKTINKKVTDILTISVADDSNKTKNKKLTPLELKKQIDRLTKEMKAASQLLEFEHAAYLRDKIKELKEANKG